MKTRRRFLVLCLAPALTLYAILVLYPTASVFRMGLYQWGGYSAQRTFVGLANFKTLFSDARFWRALQNTLLLTALVTAVTVVLAVSFAVMLSDKRLRGRSVFRVIFYIPNILSAVVIAAIFSAVYDPTRGLLSFLSAGGEPILWLGDRQLVVYSIGIIMVWQAFGYYMVMYLSGLSAIPEELYEAAGLEGASRWRQFWDVTLPLLWSTVRMTLVFFVVSSLNISFLLVRALTGGGPDGASEVALSFLYKQAYTNSAYGYGMAAGAVIFALSFALAGLLSAATKRERVEL